MVSEIYSFINPGFRLLFFEKEFFMFTPIILARKSAWHKKAFSIVFALCVAAAIVVFAGCDDDPGSGDTIGGNGEINLLIGTWASPPYDYYTISDSTLTYDDGFGNGYSGKIRHVVDFGSNSGLIIIEYAADGKPVYYDGFDADGSPIGDPYPPPGNFQGVYYKELSTVSVKMAGANDSSKTGHLAAPETAKLQEAVDKFNNIDVIDNYVTWWGTYAYTSQ
jgi:hypothetical protein